MNERTKLLAMQAGFNGEGFHNTQVGTCQETALKNFAKSIVRQCAEVAGRDVGHFILEHFGVE